MNFILNLQAIHDGHSACNKGTELRLGCDLVDISTQGQLFQGQLFVDGYMSCPHTGSSYMVQGKKKHEGCGHVLTRSQGMSTQLQ